MMFALKQFLVESLTLWMHHSEIHGSFITSRHRDIDHGLDAPAVGARQSFGRRMMWRLPLQTPRESANGTLR